MTRSLDASLHWILGQCRVARVKQVRQTVIEGLAGRPKQSSKAVAAGCRTRWRPRPSDQSALESAIGLSAPGSRREDTARTSQELNLRAPCPWDGRGARLRTRGVESAPQPFCRICFRDWCSAARGGARLD